MASTQLTSPESHVVVKDGKLRGLYKWTEWNGELCCTLSVERHADGTFTCKTDDPEHGGGKRHGTLAEVVANLGPMIRKSIIDAFGLEQAEASALRRVGFSGYRIDIK